jgi:hypothetical protein
LGIQSLVVAGDALPGYSIVCKGYSFNDDALYSGSLVPSDDLMTSNAVILATTMNGEAERYLPNTVKAYDPYRIDWALLFDQATSVSMGQSENGVYCTLEDPIEGEIDEEIRIEDRYFETVYYLSCAAADGQLGASLVEERVFDRFVSGNLERVDGVVLSYWQPKEFVVQSLEELVASPTGSGSCSSFAELLMACFSIHGIHSSFIEVRPDGTVNPGADGLLVKAWGFSQVGISSGANGINESHALGDDKSVFQYGNGLPGARCIDDGADGVLESDALGDDVRTVDSITTGPDGKTESSPAEGDDPLIPLGNGVPHASCIYPGADGLLQTIVGEGVQAFSYPPDPAYYPYLLNITAFNLPGIPAQNNGNPVSDFESHFVIQMADAYYYDPSYMVGPLLEAEHEASAKAGIWTYDGSRCRPASSGRELEYTLIYSTPQ